MKTKKKLPQKKSSTSFKSGSEWRGNGAKGKVFVQSKINLVGSLESELIKLEIGMKNKDGELDPEKPLPDFDYQGAMQGWIHKRYLDILQNLFDIIRYEDTSPTARVAAAKILLDRGFGQVPQTVNLKSEEATTYSLIAQKPSGELETVGKIGQKQLDKIENA